MSNIKTKIDPASKEENLLRLFSEAYLKGLEYVNVIEIVEKMGLVDDEYLYRKNYENTPEIVEFFVFFCYTNRVLEVNPGEDEASGIWIDNRYGLSPEWKREIKLRSILDS